MDNIERILKDTRFYRSQNMQKFFRKTRNRAYKEVIRFEGDLWFVSLGWLVKGKENGFAGVRVMRVACYGGKAETGYPAWQKGGDYEVVTDWFFEKYFKSGMYGHYEIWRRKHPQPLSHAESHTI